MRTPSDSRSRPRLTRRPLPLRPRGKIAHGLDAPKSRRGKIAHGLDALESLLERVRVELLATRQTVRCRRRRARVSKPVWFGNVSERRLASSGRSRQSRGVERRGRVFIAPVETPQDELRLTELLGLPSYARFWASWEVVDTAGDSVYLRTAEEAIAWGRERSRVV